MILVKQTPFSTILADSKDGEWGVGLETQGHQPALVIRGTDFPRLNDPGRNLPQRWIKNHLLERKKLQPGDLILETAGGTAAQPTGRCVLLRDSFFEGHGNLPVVCASFCRHLRLKREYLPEFIYYLLQSLYNSGYMAVFNIQHTGVSRFQYTTFKKHTLLPIPELSVQKKIAAVLVAYDDLIENNKRRIAILEKMGEEIYREWFVRMRFPGHENTRFEKGVPQGWTITTLGSIANIAMGQSPKSEFYNLVGDGMPFNQGVGTYGSRFPKRELYCNADVRRVRKAKQGDILFSVRAPVGRLNIADCEMIIGRGLAAMNHKQGSTSYLFYLLRTVFSSEDIIGNGSIFNSVGKDELANLKIYGPVEGLTDRFEKIAEPIDQQILQLTKAAHKLTQTRDLLLPRLISGKLSVEDLDIQFPSSMLESEAAEQETAHA